MGRGSETAPAAQRRFLRPLAGTAGMAELDRHGCSLHAFLVPWEAMAKVIQIRDVPDEVHEALASAAQARGLSLTKYMLRELEHLATRAQVVHSNAGVIRETQAKVHARLDRSTILAAIHEGRGD